MTEDEIAAHARGTLTPEQIAAHPEAATLAALRADPLYPALCATFEATEGNLLELTEDDTAVQQLATIRWALATHGPDTPIVSVAEVGFHKGFFALVLRHLLPDRYLDYFTCDIKVGSQAAADVFAGTTPPATRGWSGDGCWKASDARRTSPGSTAGTKPRRWPTT
jgi:hypothetical protein